MALTLAELEAFRGGLLAARYGGTLSVRTADGRMVTYRSDAELASALDDIERRIAAAQGSKPTRQVRVSTSKGL